MRFYPRGSSALLVSVTLFVSVAVPAQAATYYVSATGNDSNSGLSTSSAWRTANKVNTVNFAAGDKILFEGGKTFSGKIYLDANDRGTAANPIVISSYGTGRATISPGNDNAFFAYNTGGILLSNLNFVGPGASASTKDGVFFYADLAGNVKIAGITVDNVEVSGFYVGLTIGAWNGATGFRDVRISQVTARDNLHAGIFSYARQPDVHQNVTVVRSLAYNNFGNPNSSGNTGSGIVLGNVNGALIERCVAHNNGKNNFAPTEGPVGIWAYDSRNVVIQFNEAYQNRTASAKDGGGFDLDINVKNSIMQYNYSHDNDGAGYLLCCDAGNSGNIIRYNISENDGRRNGYAAIHTYGNINGAEIYNNTIFMSQTSGSPRAIWLQTGATNIRIRNNILYTTGGARLLEIAGGQVGLQIQGNSYFTGGGTFSIRWNGSNYSTLDAWRNATGQETLNGAKLGFTVDPKLVFAGAGGTFGNADLLANLTAYKLQTNSPLIDAGLNLNATFGIIPGTNDFWRTPIAQGAAYDIGAFEMPAAVSRPPFSLASPRYANQTFTFNAPGPIGTTNVVEATTNFVNWVTITNVVNTTGRIEVKDSTAKNFGRRFYRVRQL